MPRPEPVEIVNSADPIDDLPNDDAYSNEPQVVWDKIAEFKGSINGAYVTKDGELSLQIRVPFEDKYLAMPVTDVRSVLMVFAVFKPQEQITAENLDEVLSKVPKNSW